MKHIILDSYCSTAYSYCSTTSVITEGQTKITKHIATITNRRLQVLELSAGCKTVCTSYHRITCHQVHNG